DLSPDTNNLCFATGLTPAAQNIPAIPATFADTNPAPTGCPDSPSPGCDNGDGSSNPGCICAAVGDDNCCDRFFTYCAGSKVPASLQLTACGADKDCCDPTDAACLVKPVKGSCSSAPVS